MPSMRIRGESSMPMVINSFGAIGVMDNASVATPAGGAWLVNSEFYVTTTSEVYSVRTWNGGMVAVAVVVGLLTCGLGLLLLFLARREKIQTRYIETVTVTAPGLHYIERGVGGNTFVSW